MKTGNEVKTILSDNGLNKKDFSVSTKTGSYHVRIKSLEVSKDQVKEILSHLESYQRCESTGDILEGGNTFLIVDYDAKAIRDFVNANKEYIEHKIFSKYSADTPSRFLKHHGAKAIKEFFNVSENALNIAVREIY